MKTPLDTRTAAHRAKLATDKRFAAWLGLSTQDDPDPAIAAAAIRNCEDRAELYRQTQQRIIDLHEQGLRRAHPEYLASAKAYVAAYPPLQRTIGAGEASEPQASDENAATGVLEGLA